MGSSSSRLSEDGVRRRRFRQLRVFSSSCIDFPFTTSDEQTVERHRKSKAIQFRADVASYESCRDVNHCTKTTTSNTIDKNGDVKILMQQNDSGCSNSRASSVINQSSNHSCCLHSPFAFLLERVGCNICKARVVKSSDDNVSSGHNDPLGKRTACTEDIRMENNHDNDRSNVHIEASLDEYSHRNLPETDNIDTMNRCRRHGPSVPLEGSMRFSRTRSVGRLRDRVLRRNALSDDLFGAWLMEERSLISPNSQDFSGHTVARTSNSTSATLHSSLVDGSTPCRQLHNLETSQIRDTGNHDLFEHRSAFLERRRRIRSQVRALQQLGSRFENLSGHDRTCILSGQHRTGQCTCRSSNRPPNGHNDMNSSTSISRIMMLAEALFEVLDEIHQQFAAPSTRHSISSLGSVPAPKEVVDNISMRIYAKSKARLSQGVPQCNICLMEYEDGEFIRTLPCQHEFHQTCVDKWLKEIHRVCPVCRGNICR